MTNDLISREEALRVVKAYDYRGLTIEDVKKVTDGCVNELRNLPAVDAEPVVRCKDCAFYIPWGDERKICGRVGAYYGNTKPDDFCSRSVRMDLEEE